MKKAVQWETLLLLDNRFADGKVGEIMQPYAALAMLEALVLKVAWVKHQTSHLDNEFDMQMIETILFRYHVSNLGRPMKCFSVLAEPQTIMGVIREKQQSRGSPYSSDSI